MFGKRCDGRLVHEIEPFQRIVPYIMKTRTDSMNMFEENITCESMDSYIEEKKREGLDLGYLHIMIAALVRLIALRPQLNRFVVRGKIYTRTKNLGQLCGAPEPSRRWSRHHYQAGLYRNGIHPSDRRGDK